MRFAAVQSWLLVLSLAGIAGGLALLVGGGTLAVFVLGFVLAALFATPALPFRVIAGMHGGRRLHPVEAPGLFRSVADLARRARLPREPELWFLPSPVPNAFSMGVPERSAIAVSDGLLSRLTPTELLGVLAHEISHVRNRDTRFLAVADTAARVTGVLSLVGQVALWLFLPLALLGMSPIGLGAVLALLAAPPLARLVQLKLSRTREYEADLGAVRLLGTPRPLADALAKLERGRRSILDVLLPSRRREPESALMRTHPPTADRIRRLVEMEEERPDRARAWRRTPSGRVVEIPVRVVLPRRRVG